MSYLLHNDFFNTVKDKANNIAIEHEFGEQFTYQELKNMVNYVGNTIIDIEGRAQAENPFVGILSSVNAFSIASIIGTLAVGYAYVPLDEQSPIERLQKIINNLSLPTLIIDELLLEKFIPLLDNHNLKNILIISSNNNISIIDNKNIIPLLFNEVKSRSIEELPKLNKVSDDLAYILHSSGSTGVPKGIMLSHRNARTFVDWMQKEFKLSEDDIVMSRAPLKFDLSVFDIFNTLKVGAKVVCYDWRVKRENSQKHEDYVTLLEKTGATFLYTTPSTFITLMNHGKLGENSNSLRTIMYAGEPFPIPQIKQLKNLLPNTKIANIYGPTETNIITYYWIEDISPDMETIPLGHEVDDTEIVVVNPEERRLCSVGELGELWCRGGTVTLGYLGNPEKTAEHLVQSPFHPYPAKYWRTGDYGYRDKNGCLYYRGRRDHMVKIKGYRIELGEIESAISSMEDLDEFCVVVVKGKTPKDLKLKCYYSTKSKLELTEQTFIKHLKNEIPEYMIPELFQFQPELPKTSSGKIDRVLLSKLGNKGDQI